MRRFATLLSLLAAALLAVPALAQTDGNVEIVFWESIRASQDPADFRAYLERYPQGNFAVLARNRLAALERAPTPPAAPADALAPVAATPASRLPQPGDRWTYRLFEPKRADGPKERSYVVTVSAASIAAIVEKYAIDDGPAVERTDRGERQIEALGKSLFAPYLLQFGDIPNGSLGRLKVVGCANAYVCEASARVAAWERVRVAAGTFDTVKVEVQENWRPSVISGAYSAQQQGGRILTVWYAYEAKRAVKFSSRATFGSFPPIDTDFELELSSYQLK